MLALLCFALNYRFVFACLSFLVVLFVAWLCVRSFARSCVCLFVCCEFACQFVVAWLFACLSCVCLTFFDFDWLFLCARLIVVIDLL